MKLEEINNRTKDAVSYLVEALESGQSEVLTQYLSAMGRFHNYSFGNIMLIARQKPDATNVAGLRTWNSLGRFVKRGEKGIMILAPMIGHKKADSVAEAAEDAKQSQEQLYGFRAVYVFDISQTEGKDLPTLTEVQGDVSGYRERLVKFVESRGIAAGLFRNDRACQGPIPRREDHTAFRDAACRGIFDSGARDRPRDVAPGRAAYPDHQASP